MKCEDCGGYTPINWAEAEHIRCQSCQASYSESLPKPPEKRSTSTAAVSRPAQHSDQIESVDTRLATIEVIDTIEPLEGADKLERAIVAGTTVCVPRGKFQGSQVVVLIRAGSVVPPTHQFQFLKKHNYHVNIMTLRGQQSCGVLLPITVLPQTRPFVIGEDVTQALGVNPSADSLPQKPKHIQKKEMAESNEAESFEQNSNGDNIIKEKQGHEEDKPLGIMPRLSIAVVIIGLFVYRDDIAHFIATKDISTGQLGAFMGTIAGAVVAASIAWKIHPIWGILTVISVIAYLGKLLGQ